MLIFEGKKKIRKGKKKALGVAISRGRDGKGRNRFNEMVEEKSNVIQKGQGRLSTGKENKNYQTGET